MSLMRVSLTYNITYLHSVKDFVHEFDASVLELHQFDLHTSLYDGDHGIDRDQQNHDPQTWNRNSIEQIVAAFRGMHVSPAKHSFGKCDRKV